MKKFIFLLVFSFLISCGSGNDKTPSLTIVNSSNNDKTIINVTVDDYEFSGLSITNGSSKTYELLNGVSSNPVTVTVRVACGTKKYDVSNSSVNFLDGNATLLTLTHTSCDGSISAGYCRASCLK